MLTSHTFFVNFITIFFHQSRWWFSLRKTFKSLSKNNTFDCVYIPSIDFVIHPSLCSKVHLGIRLLWKFNFFKKIIWSKPSENMKYKNRVKKHIYTLLIKRLLSAKYLLKLFIIEQNIYKELQHRSFVHYEKIEYLPDFLIFKITFQKKNSEKFLACTNQICYFSLRVLLSIRKGAINLLKVLLITILLKI